MHLLAKLVPLGEPAHDKSVITETSMREYLDSDKFRSSLKNGRLIGGMTHTDRQDESGNLKPLSDRLLLSSNITHYVTDLHIDKGWLMCDVELEDDLSLYSGKALDYITTILRFINNKLELSVSIVVDAEWDEEQGYDISKTINTIYGFDFTITPGFEGAKIIY